MKARMQDRALRSQLVRRECGACCSSVDRVKESFRRVAPDWRFITRRAQIANASYLGSGVTHETQESAMQLFHHNTNTIRAQSPNPGQDPEQPPVPQPPSPSPGEVPSPVRDVPPGQPTDPVPNQPIDIPPYQPTDPVRTG
jgi:hypothetical protein